MPKKDRNAYNEYMRKYKREQTRLLREAKKMMGIPLDRRRKEAKKELLENENET